MLDVLQEVRSYMAQQVGVYWPMLVVCGLIRIHESQKGEEGRMGNGFLDQEPAWLLSGMLGACTPKMVGPKSDLKLIEFQFQFDLLN